ESNSAYLDARKIVHIHAVAKEQAYRSSLTKQRRLSLAAQRALVALYVNRGINRQCAGIRTRRRNHNRRSWSPGVVQNFLQARSRRSNRISRCIAARSRAH